jgi:hypothetical protein
VWSGVAYHLVQFTRVNPAAFLFGSLFVLQGALFAWCGSHGTIRFESIPGSRRWIGTIGIVYALLLYPLLGAALGHDYPAAPTFGAPCPSTIFTFGLLLWTQAPLPLRLLVIPSLWAVLTAPVALGWGVWQDAAMPIIALVTVILMIRRSRGSADDARGRVRGVPGLST